MLLVVNKVHSSIDAVEMKGEIEAAYRSPVACVLPLSDDMVRLGSAARSLRPSRQLLRYVTALRDVLAYLEPRHASAG